MSEDLLNAIQMAAIWGGGLPYNPGSQLRCAPMLAAVLSTPIERMSFYHRRVELSIKFFIFYERHVLQQMQKRRDSFLLTFAENLLK